MKAGLRQTVCRVLHPNRGEGIAVYDNGPSFFQPDGGEPVAMRIDFGGCGPDGAWRDLQDPEHGPVRAKVLRNGECHRRMWSPLFGAGWLVAEREFFWHRFDGDDGSSRRFDVHAIAVGTPDYVRRSSKKRSRVIEMTPEEERWRTYTISDGTVLAFRSGEAPTQQAPDAHGPHPAQLTLLAVKP